MSSVQTKGWTDVINAVRTKKGEWPDPTSGGPMIGASRATKAPSQRRVVTRVSQYAKKGKRGGRIDPARSAVSRRRLRNCAKSNPRGGVVGYADDCP